MTTQQPTPPSSEESQFYYFGLPSYPKLIARSSAHAWKRPEKPEFSMWMGLKNWYPKSLRPAGRNPLLHQLWNDNTTSSLRVKIVEAVSAVADWIAIDILRIGLNEDFHTTLLISVKPDSLSWDRGHPLALRCKAILEDHGLHDIHCEIREPVVTFFYHKKASPSDSAATGSSIPGDFKLSSERISEANNDIQVDLSDRLSTKIGMKHTNSVFGTKGLYLALSPSSSTAGGKPRVVALTCRHVVIDSQTEGVQTYRQESEPPREVIQMDQPNFEESLECVAYRARGYRRCAAKFSECDKADAAAEYSRIADDYEALLRKMKSYEAASSRVFGHLLYSPEFTCASSEHGASKWLRDWALVELLPGSHQAELGLLKNKVLVGSWHNFESHARKDREGWKELPDHGCCQPILDCTVELEKIVVPMEEIFRTDHFAEDIDEPALFVAKYGANGGLTFGLGNTLKSVVRRAETPEGESISEEWAITTVSNAASVQEPFSLKGDSGSCIWDMERRVAGMIMAGAGPEGSYDITYAQPAERLLADIRAHGFDVSLV